MTDQPADADLDWVKSSLSIATGACVELAMAGDLVALRDSKSRTTAPFYFTRLEMRAFLEGAKRGEFDHVVPDV
jgi:hypothetical protein